MPQPGDRKIKDGVLGEFDGTTWRVVAEPGTRKTKDGVTGEWNGSTWVRVNDVGEAAQQPSMSSPSTLSPGLAVAAGMAAAPAVVGAVRSAAQAAPSIVPRIAPALTAVAVADDLRRGNVRQAAYDAVGGTVASRYVPKVVKPLAQGVANAARNTGIITRLANAAARYAGPVGLVIDAISTPGHRYNETPDEVAARQAEFQRQYDAMRRR